jgi:hypothetical protein
MSVIFHNRHFHRIRRPCDLDPRFAGSIVIQNQQRASALKIYQGYAVLGPNRGDGVQCITQRIHYLKFTYHTLFQQRV